LERLLPDEYPDEPMDTWTAIWEEHMNGRQVQAWKQEILDLRCGHELSFFRGTQEEDCPEVVRQIEDLHALIMEHTA
jgi:hypothetical protein